VFAISEKFEFVLLAKNSKRGGGVHLPQENQDLFWMVQMGLFPFPRMR